MFGSYLEVSIKLNLQLTPPEINFTKLVVIFTKNELHPRHFLCLNYLMPSILTESSSIRDL